MRRLICLHPVLAASAILAALLHSAAPARSAPGFDFQSASPPRLLPLEPKPGASGVMRGVIPQGWRDDSAWADLSGEYLTEEFEGTRYLRVRLDRVIRGAAQLAAPFPDAKPGTAYELRLAVRAPKPLTFAVQIRQDGPPYRQYWREEVRAVSPGAFEEIVLETPALPPMERPLLLLAFSAAGVVDFRSVTVAPRQETPEPSAAAPRNLLRMSRFPLGPQNGMMLYREVSDETCEFQADPEVTGPSGSPALRVASGANKKFHFDGELISGLRRGQPHTASVFIKGEGSLILSAMSAREGGAKTEKEKFFRVRPDEGWKRVVLPFTAARDTPNQYLRFTVRGRLWLDGMMVSPGNEAPDFAGQGAAEAALALPEGKASLAGIQFDDEPPLLRWAVVGAPPGSRLLVEVADAAGGAASLDPIPLQGLPLEEGTLDYGRIPGRPLGAFRVNAMVADASGKPLSPWAERIVLRVLTPRFWDRPAPESAFGQHIRPAKRHILMAKALGNNWARLHNDGAHITDWAYLEPEPGQWKWSDDDLQRYLDGRLCVLGQFSTAPKWASYLADTGIEGDGGYFGKYFLPKDLKTFASYVTALAARYKGKITAYEVWNEPWQVRWFGAAYVEEDGRRKIVSPRDAARRYADLCRAAWQAAKAVDPSITIVGLNTTSTPEPRPGPDGYMDGKSWTAGFIKAGGLQWCDVVSYHTYDPDPNGFPGDSGTRGVRTAVGPNDLFKRIPKPVWMSEGSSTVGGRLRFGLYKHTLPYRNPEDVPALAESVLRYDLSLLSNGVEKIFLYSMGDHGQGEPGAYRSGVTLDGSAHPAAIGRATLAWHVDGLRFVRHTEPAAGVHVYFFEGGGRSAAVIAPQADHAPFSVNAGEGVAVRDIWGNLQPPGAVPIEKSTLLVSADGAASALESRLR